MSVWKNYCICRKPESAWLFWKTYIVLTVHVCINIIINWLLWKLKTFVIYIFDKFFDKIEKYWCTCIMLISICPLRNKYIMKTCYGTHFHLFHCYHVVFFAWHFLNLISKFQLHIDSTLRIVFYIYSIW